MSDKRYHTAGWLRRRSYQLRAEPLCRFCQQAGRTTPATVADHIEPHRGDAVKFWCGDLQSLCATCHSSTKQLIEKSGRIPGCDQGGRPLDPSHHWNR